MALKKMCIVLFFIVNAESKLQASCCQDDTVKQIPSKDREEHDRIVREYKERDEAEALRHFYLMAAQNYFAGRTGRR